MTDWEKQVMKWMKAKVVIFSPGRPRASVILSDKVTEAKYFRSNISNRDTKKSVAVILQSLN